MTGAGKYQRLDLASIVRRAAEEALERRFSARHQPRPRWGGAKIRRKAKRKAPAPAVSPKRLRVCGVCGELGHRADSPRHTGLISAPAPASAVAAVTEICRHGTDANCRRCLKDSAAAETEASACSSESPSAPRVHPGATPAAAETISRAPEVTASPTAPAAAAEEPAPEAPPPPEPRRRTARACTVCGELGHRADNARHRLDALPPSPPPSAPAAASWPDPVANRPRGAAAPQWPASRRSFLPVLPVVTEAPPTPLVGAAELAEVLAENDVDLGADDEVEVAGATAPAPPPETGCSADGDERDPVAAVDSPAAAPKRLSWTPAPDDGAEEEVPALAALASGRWGGRHASIPADHRLRAEVRLPALSVLSDAEAEAILPRPVTRGDCANVPRPCPFVSCAHHLYLDVNEDTGTLKLNHPGEEPWELMATCALDVAEAGGVTIDGVGVLVGLTRERIRQVEVRALEKLRRGVPDAGEADSPGPALRHPHGEVAA